MSDREMLELAAKAAGIFIESCPCSDPKWPLRYDEAKMGKHGHWNPLVHDGDALRLAVTLRIDIEWSDATWGEGFDIVEAYHRLDGPYPCMSEDIGQDAAHATRRAIVRAAALLAQKGE